MKIIKAGNLEKLRKIKQFTCHQCGCIFEANVTEYKTGSQYNQTYYYTICPCCINKVYLRDEQLSNKKSI